MRAIVFACLALAVSASHAQKIELPDVKGRIDHFGIDADGQRLFVAALGNNTVEVIDLKSNKHVRTLKGFAEPQGIQLVSAARRIYVSNGKADRVDVLDAATYAVMKRIDGLGDADNIRYDAAAQLLYVAYEGGLRVLDAMTGEPTGDLKLRGHPESFQLEKAGPRIFANLPGSREVAVVDRAQGAVSVSWKLDGASGNYPMALDEATHRLFVGTRNPPLLFVFDTESGKTVAKLSIGRDTDDVFFDVEAKRVVVVCGEGVVNLFRQQDPDHYPAEKTVKTAPRARTGFLFAGLLYVAAPAINRPAAVTAYDLK